MLFGVANFDRQAIINNNVALLKAAKVFGVPVVLSTVETKSFSGNMWPQIQAVFPNQTPIERSSMNSWDDKNFVAAIEKNGKKKIVLAGLWTETCVALPTVQAIHDNYEVYVVEDCCGDVSQLAHTAAFALVDPVLDQTCGGDVVVPVAKPRVSHVKSGADAGCLRKARPHLLRTNPFFIVVFQPLISCDVSFLTIVMFSFQVMG
ncbi:MAG: isochorismatase family protein [Gammaproteobacteria bacterium]